MARKLKEENAARAIEWPGRREGLGGGTTIQPDPGGPSDSYAPLRRTSPSPAHFANRAGKWTGGGVGSDPWTKVVSDSLPRTLSHQDRNSRSSAEMSVGSSTGVTVVLGWPGSAALRARREGGCRGAVFRPRASPPSPGPLSATSVTFCRPASSSGAGVPAESARRAAPHIAHHYRVTDGGLPWTNSPPTRLQV